MSRARWDRRIARLGRYAAACERIGGTPGRGFPRRFVHALWHRDAGRYRRFTVRVTADGDLAMVRRSPDRPPA